MRFHVMQLAVKVISHFNSIVFTFDIRLVILTCLMLILAIFQSFNLYW